MQRLIDHQLMIHLIVIGLSAFYLTSLVRKFSWVQSRVMAGVRPWACNACMSFWTMLPPAVVHLQTSETHGAWPIYMAASGLCYFLLEFLEPPPPQLPPPPPDAR